MVRVDRVHIRAGVPGEFLPDFLRDASVRHCRVEAVSQAVSQAVETQAFIRPALLCMPSDCPDDARLSHDLGELAAESRFTACAFAGQRRKEKRFANAGVF